MELANWTENKTSKQKDQDKQILTVAGNIMLHVIKEGLSNTSPYNS